VTFLTGIKQLCFVNESPGRSYGCSGVTFLVFKRLGFVVHMCGQSDDVLHTVSKASPPPRMQHGDNGISY
jgi:hypothetical protein